MKDSTVLEDHCLHGIYKSLSPPRKSQGNASHITFHTNTFFHKNNAISINILKSATDILVATVRLLICCLVYLYLGNNNQYISAVCEANEYVEGNGGKQGADNQTSSRKGIPLACTSLALFLSSILHHGWWLVASNSSQVGDFVSSFRIWLGE